MAMRIPTVLAALTLAFTTSTAQAQSKKVYISVDMEGISGINGATHQPQL